MLLILFFLRVVSIYFGPAVFLLSTVCVCSGDKPINHSILIGPRHHLSDYCILLTLRDTISYPLLFTPPIHFAFHCCSAHASQMKAMLHSVNNTERIKRLAFIHNGEVGCCGGRDALSGRRCHVTQ